MSSHVEEQQSKRYEKKQLIETRRWARLTKKVCCHESHLLNVSSIMEAPVSPSFATNGHISSTPINSKFKFTILSMKIPETLRNPSKLATLLHLYSPPMPFVEQGRHAMKISNKIYRKEPIMVMPYFATYAIHAVKRSCYQRSSHFFCKLKCICGMCIYAVYVRIHKCMWKVCVRR